MLFLIGLRFSPPVLLSSRLIRVVPSKSKLLQISVYDSVFISLSCHPSTPSPLPKVALKQGSIDRNIL